MHYILTNRAVEQLYACKLNIKGIISSMHDLFKSGPTWFHIWQFRTTFTCHLKVNFNSLNNAKCFKLKIEILYLYDCNTKI